VKFLLDECVDRRLARHLAGHEVKTARQMGWTTIKNGELLALAPDAFDVFVTVDRNLSFQQNLGKLPIAVIVLASRTNRLADLIPCVPELLAALAGAKRGTATVVASEAATKRRYPHMARPPMSARLVFSSPQSALLLIASLETPLRSPRARA
jgi:hypothetical protein